VERHCLCFGGRGFVGALGPSGVSRATLRESAHLGEAGRCLEWAHGSVDRVRTPISQVTGGAERSSRSEKCSCHTVPLGQIVSNQNTIRKHERT
jgi:hypothetical protein